MTGRLILPIMAFLVCVLALSAIMLMQDGRRRREKRSLDISASSLPDAAEDPFQMVRVRLQRPGKEWRRTLMFALLRYDPDAPRDWPASRVVITGVLAGVVCAVFGRMTLPPLAVLPAAILAALFVVRTLFGYLHDKYSDRLLRQLPDTISLIVGAVRAGLPVAEAFRAVAREMPNPTCEQFKRVVNDMALGQPADATLLSLHNRTRVAEYAIFSVTLGVQTRAGGRLAETLQTLGETVRQRIAIAGRAKALAGEAKLSALVLSCLPFVSGVAMSIVRPGYMDPLFHDPTGRKLFAGGVVSLILGVLTMRNMIKKGTSV